jgi:TolB-like protein/Flp pilus assembly protein TadD
MSEFISRLRERKLLEWAVAYLAGAWLFIEALDLIAETFGWPEIFVRACVILAAAGLLAVLVLAWHHGASGRQSLSRRELAALIVILVGAAASVAIWGPAASSSPAETGILAPRAGIEPSVAVLPFTTRAARADYEATIFADGMHDDLITELSRINSLKVISRTSVERYRGTDLGLPEIARELGANAIIEAAVDRLGDRVRFNVQLIDAATDSHLWAESYDEELSVENIFGIRSDLARKVAAALSVVLTPEELEVVEARPTENLEAYDYYQRGLRYFRTPGAFSKNLRSARRMLEQAVEVDPDFALAHAWLSITNSRLYFFRAEFEEDVRLAAEGAALRALELEPGLPEGHLALGLYYYHGLEDYETSFEELTRAIAGLPNSSQVHGTIGFLNRRRGRWTEAIASLARAAELDPRNADWFWELGDTYRVLRDYDTAADYYQQSLDVSRVSVAAYGQALNALMRDGDLDPLRRFARGYESFVSVLVRLRYLERDYDGALAALSEYEDDVFEGQLFYTPKDLLAALSHRAAGDQNAARKLFEAARSRLEEAVGERPDDRRRYRALALSYAGLGRLREAEEASARAWELSAQDHFEGVPLERENRARMYVLLGDDEGALEELDGLLSHPGWVSAAVLRIDPFWDVLRDDPRFEALLAAHAKGS